MSGLLWTLGVSVALVIMTVGAGLVAGFVGGYRLGVIRNSVVAALMILPSTCVLAGLWIFLVLLGVPVFGFFAGLLIGIMTALMSLGRLVVAAATWIVGDKNRLPTATLVRDSKALTRRAHGHALPLLVGDPYHLLRGAQLSHAIPRSSGQLGGDAWLGR